MVLSILITKGIKKNIGTLIAICILLTLIFFSLATAITIYQNAGSYVNKEQGRLGYGDITTWVSNVNDISDLLLEISKVSDVEKANAQEVIYSGYSINGTHSDNEGQLIKYDNSYAYYILKNDLKGYGEISNINNNEIYISPSMLSSYDVKIGDKIKFELSRDGEKRTFTIAGYFEDPFMGSSMIDMKSFLISEDDFKNIENEINQLSSSTVLARNGAMLHIFQKEDSELTINEFNMEINTHTNIGNYTEFVYNRDTIYSFMMILQNVFIGFLISFVIVLLIVSIIIINNSVSSAIDNDKKDFGILKTMGFTSKKLRVIQVIQYGSSIIVGVALSLILENLLLGSISKSLITSTGFILPTKLPAGNIATAFILITLILLIAIIRKTSKIVAIKPIEIISEANNDNYSKKSKGTISKNDISIDIAIRDIVSGKKRYIGTFVIAILLTFFVLTVVRLHSWLGKNGEGLMNAFSVADYDLGIEPKVHVDMNEVQNLIRSYAEIENVYSLAMQNVTLNGVSYTANIIDNTSWFHVLSGRTVENQDEIVITQMVANELSVKIGDKVQINYEHTFQEYKVVGIYQCANEMGANIGMNKEGFARIGNVNSYIWCYHFILSDHTHSEEIMKVLQNKYPMQMDVHTNSWSGLDGIVKTMNMLVIFMYGLIVVFILVTELLTTNKILNFEEKNMGIYKSIGFTSKDLRISFGIRFFIIALCGGVTGMIFSILFADSIIAQLVSIFGIGEFVSTLSLINIITPVFLIALLFGIFSYISSGKIKKISIINLVKN